MTAKLKWIRRENLPAGQGKKGCIDTKAPSGCESSGA